jgi:uncharacterized protein YjbJ (UPF0337 family)
MNKNTFKSRWEEIRAEVRRRWGQLTDDDLEAVGGDVDRLIGCIEKRYGQPREHAAREVDGWCDELESGGRRAVGGRE